MTSDNSNTGPGMTQEAHDIAVEVTRAAPIVAGSLASYITASEVLTYLTIGYTVVLIVYLIRKWIREETEWGKKMRSGGDRS